MRVQTVTCNRSQITNGAACRKLWTDRDDYSKKSGVSSSRRLERPLPRSKHGCFILPKPLPPSKCAHPPFFMPTLTICAPHSGQACRYADAFPLPSEDALVKTVDALTCIIFPFFPRLECAARRCQRPAMGHLLKSR